MPPPPPKDPPMNTEYPPIGPTDPVLQWGIVYHVITSKRDEFYMKLKVPCLGLQKAEIVRIILVNFFFKVATYCLKTEAVYCCK